MITNELRHLIDRLTSTAVEELRMERELRKHLRASDQATLSEIAYCMYDVLLMRNDLQPASLHRVEQYIAKSLRLAEWHAQRDLAQDELDTILASLENWHFLADEDDDADV